MSESHVDSGATVRDRGEVVVSAFEETHGVKRGLHLAGAGHHIVIIVAFVALVVVVIAGYRALRDAQTVRSPEGMSGRPAP